MIPEVLKKMLPVEISLAADKLNINDLYEIRLRSDRAVSVNFKGGFYYLSNKGLIKKQTDAIVCTAKEIKEVLVKATEYSLYAVNNQICNAYLTVSGGIRIGIAGETVWDESNVKTIKNFNALNIRLPHEVTGCGTNVMKYIAVKSKADEILTVHNTLILSPPGAGKTTLLRDLARIIGSAQHFFNVLIVDERNEIASMNEGKMTLNIGINSDVINGCNKRFAFTRAVRALRPDIIITDELFDGEDVAATEYAMGSGVKVIASVHASGCRDLFLKKEFERVINSGIFSRYVSLSDRHGPGTLESVADENFNEIYSYEQNIIDLVSTNENETNDNVKVIVSSKLIGVAHKAGL